MIYDEWNPAMIDSISVNGVYFTPAGLCRDVAAMAQVRGNVVDCCAGIGKMVWWANQYDYYHKRIKSITCIEINPDFVEIGKRLLPQANWVCGSIYDKSIWDKITKDLPNNKFDDMLSNPPFGKNGQKIEWLNYNGSRDLMAVELCLRYAKSGYFILPSGSVSFAYSGERYYKQRMSRDVEKFVKANKEFPFSMIADGIDTSIYEKNWQNLKGIRVEACNIAVHPFYSDWVEDTLIYQIENNLFKHEY
jgi:predicted RNA methylase